MARGVGEVVRDRNGSLSQDLSCWCFVGGTPAKFFSVQETDSCEQYIQDFTDALPASP